MRQIKLTPETLIRAQAGTSIGPTVAPDYIKSSQQTWPAEICTTAGGGRIGPRAVSGDRAIERSLVSDREAALLAPYAFFSRDTAGRKYAEPTHRYRGPFQRDRDRILHSSAFRRLSGKMQVFTGEMGDYPRTRLTHTMEVASIARTVARVLRLNEDLVEAAALLHDIGHPPFGHAGEDALNECLVDEGGFSHNQFALTLVEELELRYPTFPGLNLSRELLEGQLARVDKTGRGDPQPYLEFQVVDAADSIAYNAHDLDDALKLGLLTMHELHDVPLAGDVLRAVREKTAVSYRSESGRQEIVRHLIDRQVRSVLEYCLPEFERRAWKSADAARRSGFVIEPQEDVRHLKAGLEDYLYQRVYRHPQLLRMRGIAQARLREMLEYYVKHPDDLPRQFQRRGAQLGMRRSAAEYLAGMTDRFFQRQFAEALG